MTFLYRNIPVEERVCHICGKYIHRNIDMIDGAVCHHGCLNKVGLQPIYRCFRCFSLLTVEAVVRVQFYPGETVTKTCGNCGSTNLKPLRTRKPEVIWWKSKKH